jgi:PAS domain S-box-containing protein
VDRMVARLNVENFKALIAKEADDGKRRILLSLLAAEEAKLAGLIRDHKGGGDPGVSNQPARPEPDRTSQRATTPAQDWRLDAALANMPHGLCIFDADRRLTLCNSRYAEMYRLPPELLVPGTALESIIAYRHKIGNGPVDFPNYASHDGIEFKQEGNSIFHIRLEDGRTIRLNHLVLKGGGYVATHEDITETVRSEERFRSIFDAVSEGIFILDPTTRTILEVNEPGSLMLGCSAEELVGREMQALSSGVPPYTQNEAAEWIARAAASGRPQRFAWQSKTKAGRIFPVEVAMRFASISGRPVVLAVLRDLTEQQAIESQLRQSQRMEVIGQLTGRMAHDFNALLAVIIGKLEVLRETYPNDPRINQLAGDALEAALRCESYAMVAGYRPTAAGPPVVELPHPAPRQGQ